MNRRNFIKSMLAACAAPAIVKADSLMGLYVPSKKIVVPYGVLKFKAFDMNSKDYYTREFTVNVGHDEINMLKVGDLIQAPNDNFRHRTMRIYKTYYKFDSKNSTYMGSIHQIDDRHINAYGA